MARSSIRRVRRPAVKQRQRRHRKQERRGRFDVKFDIAFSLVVPSGDSDRRALSAVYEFASQTVAVIDTFDADVQGSAERDFYVRERERGAVD